MSHSDAPTGSSDGTPYHRPRRAAVVLNGDEEEGSMSEHQLEHYTAFKNITSSSSKKTSETPSHSVTHSNGKSSGTTSTDTLDPDAFGPAMRERRLHAMEASGNAPFRQLKSYVAFAEDVSSHGSEGGDRSTQDDTAPSNGSAGGAGVRGSGSHSSTSTSPRVVQKSLSTAGSGGSTAGSRRSDTGKPPQQPQPQAHHPSDATTTDSTFSAFSAAPAAQPSLSQFAPSLAGPTDADPGAGSGPTVSSSGLPPPSGAAVPIISAASPVLPSPSSFTAGAPAAASPPSPSSPPVTVTTPVGFTTSPPAGGMTFPMPPLPPAGAGIGLGGMTAATTATATTLTGAASRAPSTNPSPASPLRPSAALLPLTAAEREEKEKDAAHSRRMDELRETSLAVERLVTAFASLRGHAPPPPPTSSSPTAAPLPSKTVEGRDSTTAHCVGAASSLRTTTVRPLRHEMALQRKQQPQADPGNEEWAAASAANTLILEESLQQCVLALMAERAAGEGRTDAPRQRSMMTKTASPTGRYHMSVAADDFLVGQPAKPPGMRRAGRSRYTSSHHLSVFDGEMSALAPERFSDDSADADTVLQKGIEDALNKYVWQRVAWPSSDGLKSLAEPLSSDVVFVMLLDVIGLCQAILEHGFSSDGSSTSVDAPVLVQYVGPTSLQSLARTILHCLPFEALTNQKNEKTIFRLEYWVSRERVLSVANAVNGSLRVNTIRYACALRFSPFREENLLGAAVERDGLGPPPASPVFTLLPLNAHARRLVREGESGARGPTLMRRADHHHTMSLQSEVLGVGVNALEGLAFSVSKLSSSILEEENRHVMGLTSSQRQGAEEGDGAPIPLAKFNTPEDFQSLSAVVATTVDELLSDEAILSAVKRRAAAKWKAQLASKDHLNRRGLSRQEQEKVIVQRAEAEAAELVARVMQEMKAQSMITSG